MDSEFRMRPLCDIVRRSVKDSTCQCSRHQETWVQSLGGEDPLEKAMVAHCSVLAWRIPWTEEPGGYSPWGRKESNMTE